MLTTVHDAVERNLEKIEITGGLDLANVTVSDFQPARVMDISFNPYRVLKSFLKQFYQVGIKEKCYSLLRPE